MRMEVVMRYLACLVLAFIFCGELANAQKTVEDNRDYDFENWRVLFQLNGPNNWNASLNFVKPIKPKLAIRFGISPVISFNRSIGDVPNPELFVSFEEKSKIRRLGADVSLGAEFHLVQKAKLDPYILFGTGIGGFSERVDKTYAYRLAEPSNNDQIAYESEERSKSAPQITIRPFAGFGVNYFFHKRIAFGIEYSVSPLMDIIKGKTKSFRSTKETFEDGTVDEFSSEDNSDINGFFVIFSQRIGFHMIYTLQNKRNKGIDN